MFIRLHLLAKYCRRKFSTCVSVARFRKMKPHTPPPPPRVIRVKLRIPRLKLIYGNKKSQCFLSWPFWKIAQFPVYIFNLINGRESVLLATASKRGGDSCLCFHHSQQFSYVNVGKYLKPYPPSGSNFLTFQMTVDFPPKEWGSIRFLFLHRLPYRDPQKLSEKNKTPETLFTSICNLEGGAIMINIIGAILFLNNFRIVQYLF